MAKSAYIGVSETARKVKGIYIGVNGVARKVTKGSVGVNGVARQFFEGESPGKWAEAQLPEVGDWCDIAYGNHRFIAIRSDQSQCAYIGDDETNWCAHVMPGSTGWRAISTHNSKFYAVKLMSGTIAYSDFGQSWYTERIFSSGTYDWTDIYNNIAVTHGTIGANYTNSSWAEAQQITLPSYQRWHGISKKSVYDIVVLGSGNVVAHYTNTSGSWAQATLPTEDSWTDSAFGNGIYVAISNGSTAAKSADGVTWVQTAMPASAKWERVCFGDGKFVAVASNSNLCTHTTDGVNWSLEELPSVADWSGIAYGGGRFVAVAKNSDKSAWCESLSLGT